jgi:hypothetical protein
MIHIHGFKPRAYHIGWPSRSLDDINETISRHDAETGIYHVRWLHPTKGWRKLSPKRARAQQVLADVQAKGGWLNPRTIHSTGHYIKEGY